MHGTQAALDHTISIPCNKGAVHLIQHNNQLILIDPGYMGQTIGASSWVQFTLVPHIIKHTGRTYLDHCIVLQPSAMTFKAVESLMLKMPITHLYIPYWQGTLSRAGLHAYGALKNKSHLIRLGSHPTSITNTISIEPLGSSIVTPTLNYCASAVHAFIDNQDITLYPAKYKNRHQHKTVRLAHQRYKSIGWSPKKPSLSLPAMNINLLSIWFPKTFLNRQDLW